MSGASAVQAAGGDEVSVRDALARVFDAQKMTGGVVANGPSVGQGLAPVDKIARRVGIAKTLSATDAPGEYLDAIKIAEESVQSGALTRASANKMIEIVRGAAARHVSVSWAASREGERPFVFDEIAAAAYGAAASGDKKETARALASYDQWESLLGTPANPLLSGTESLKSDVRGRLAPEAARASARSAPHVYFKLRGTTYAADLPSASRVSALPALAGLFRLSADALASLSPFSRMRRDVSSGPGAFAAARAVYAGDLAAADASSGPRVWLSVPLAAARAARYWLARVFESIRRGIAALFWGAPSYDLSRDSGRDSLRRAALLGATARAEAAAARGLLSGTRTFAGAEKAFDAAAHAAAAFDQLTGENFARSIASLRAGYDSAARDAEPGSPLSARAAVYVDGPGGLAEILQRLDANARVDAARLSLPVADGLVDLGPQRGSAFAAATRARESLGVNASFVALGDQLWARAPGVSLAADLKDSESGGFADLKVARDDGALAGRLEKIGFAVTVEGRGLRATLGGDGFGRDADVLGFLAAQGLAASLGRPPVADPTLSRLSADLRRERKSAETSAKDLDGVPFLSAPVIGAIGSDRVFAPVAARVRGRVGYFAVLVGPNNLPHFALPLTAR